MQRLVRPSVVNASTRQFSTSHMTRKSAADVESGISYWSSASSDNHLYPTPSRDRGGLFPESSKHAQQRAWSVQSSKWARSGVSDTSRGVDRKGDSSATAFPSVGEPLGNSDAEYTRPPDGTWDKEEARRIGRMDYQSIIKFALERVIDLHSPSPPPKQDDHPPGSEEHTLGRLQEKTPSSSDTKAGLLSSVTPSPTTSSTTTPKLPPPLPPILTRLVQTRNYRLAVLHVLNNPHLASDHSMVLRLAHRLELRGAGSCAQRLRDSVAQWRIEAEQNGYTENQTCKLAPKSENQEGKPGYWSLPTVPTPHHEWVRTKSLGLTTHLNGHLSFMLRKCSLQPRLSPLDAPQHSPPKGEGAWPPARPNLRQLRQLLYTIHVFEGKYGFKPDRVTANIILGCWFHCASPTRDMGPDPYVFLDHGEGTEPEMKLKKRGPRVMDKREIMMLFRVVSMVIMRSVSLSEKEMQKRAEEYKRLHPEIDMVPSRPTHVPASITATVSTTQDPTSLDSSTQPNESSQMPQSAPTFPIKLDVTTNGENWDISHHKHVRPFASMVLNAMRWIGNMDNERAEVMRWEKDVRGRLETVGAMRFALEQAMKLDQTESG